MNRGFTLIEILISLILLSVGVLGFLALDRDSLHWLTKTTTLEQKNQIIFEVNELIEEHDTLQTLANPCPACVVFSQLNDEWLAWQSTLPKYLTATLSADSPSTLTLTLCEDEQCTNTVFQV
jgi:prepilin-type N-terminal cleavage/methylation domain-containing protein